MPTTFFARSVWAPANLTQKPTGAQSGAGRCASMTLGGPALSTSHNTHQHQPPWLLVLAVPALLALATVVLRILLHHGHWNAVPLFEMALVACGPAAVLTSAFAAERAPQGWGLFAFCGWLVGQVVLAAGLMFGLWAVLPLRFAGP